MRSLEINRQPLWYATFKNKEEILDKYGNHTGTFKINYNAPVYYPVNVSESRGTADKDMFGIAADYDRTFTTTDMNCPIKEDSVIWFGADPTTDPHNYIVYRIANSLNSITYAIRGVDVTKTVISG